MSLNKVDNNSAAGCATIIVGIFAMCVWVGVVYIIVHFAIKYW